MAMTEEEFEKRLADMEARHTRQMELMMSRMEGMALGAARGSTEDFKLPHFKETGENWEEFRFKLKAKEAAKDNSTGERLLQLEQPRQGPITMSSLTADEQARSRHVYHTLSMTVTGPNFNILRRIRDQNGYEAYRQLNI